MPSPVRDPCVRQGVPDRRSPSPADMSRRPAFCHRSLLFRFSALTFNADRIHDDRPCAISQEGYPGPVVHGPLTAMLLANLVRRNTARPMTAFSFRGLAPLFDLAPSHLIGPADGASVSLEALGPDHACARSATGSFDLLLCTTALAPNGTAADLQGQLLWRNDAATQRAPQARIHPRQAREIFRFLNRSSRNCGRPQSREAF